VTFRDDHDALLARADALQRERDSLAERLTGAESERDEATRTAAKLTDENATLRAIADPKARRRDRLIVALIAVPLGGAVMFGSLQLIPKRRPAKAPPDAAVDAPADVAAPPDARDIGTPPLRVDQVNAGRFYTEGGWSVRTHYTVTRLRDLPEGTVTKVKLTCMVNGERRVANDPIGVPGPPIAVGEGAVTYVDQFMWAPIVPDPSRCEALVYVQMPGASNDVIDHEAGRFCFDIKGPATAQTITATRGPCP